MIICTLQSPNLGDTWAGVSYLLKNNSEVGISNLAVLNKNRGTRAVGPLAAEIAPLLKTDSKMVITDQFGPILSLHLPFRESYIPTRRRWVGDVSKDVILHFEGRYMGEFKSTPPDDRVALIDALTHSGWHPYVLPPSLSLEEMVIRMTECRYFIGVDSGPMHVAHSVGVPRALVKNRMTGIEVSHHAKEVAVYATTAQLVRNLPPSLRDPPGNLRSPLTDGV